MRFFAPKNDFQPLSRRVRLGLVLAALVAALLTAVTMLTPHLKLMEAKRKARAADVPPCAPGQTSGCVGGTMGVLVVAPVAPLPGPSAASR